MNAIFINILLIRSLAITVLESKRLFIFLFDKTSKKKATLGKGIKIKEDK